MSETWDFFIAYRTADRRAAEVLADLLAEDAEVFLDSRSLRPGEDWDLAIRDALENSAIIVVLISPETDRAFFAREEILRAIDLSLQQPDATRLVPVFIHGAAPNDSSVPYGLRPKQGLVAQNDENLLEVASELVALLADTRSEVAEPQRFSAAIRHYLAQLHRDVEFLTQEQYRLIRELRYLRRVRISGCAGSGKTLVAAEKAARLAEAGLRVLFLCHNPLLAEYVARLIGGSGVEVADFGTWSGSAGGADDETPAPAWTQFSEPDAATLARAAENHSTHEQKYDAIVVDEGQDFRDEWWLVVESALRSPTDGIFYIFHDNNQSLLPYRGSYPIIEPHIDLSRNCRNAGRVFELVRCYDSTSPEPELRLKEKGKVILKVYESGEEQQALVEVLAPLGADGLLDDCVALWAGLDQIDACPIANLRVEASRYKPWQAEVRRQFAKACGVYLNNGLDLPSGGQQWVNSELERLSFAPYPSRKDIEMVREVAQAFKIDRDVRARIEKLPAFRRGFHWVTAGESLKLRRKTRGPIWGAEVILHFLRDDWQAGIPEPAVFRIVPFLQPRMPGAIPLYSIPDFKGLEADTVLLVMRGRTLSQRQATYVGVSRARALLVILADSSSAATLPRSFTWDA